MSVPEILVDLTTAGSANEVHSYDNGYGTVKKHLDKILLPLMIKRKELKDKLVARTQIIEEFRAKKAAGELPKCIKPMSMPQVPKSVEPEFKAQFEVLVSRAAKESLNLLIQHRVRDLSMLQTELQSVVTKMNETVKDALSFIKEKADYDDETVQAMEIRYSNDLQERLQSQNRNQKVELAFKSFNKTSREVQQAEDAVMNPPDQEPNNEISKLQQELQTIKATVKQLQSSKPQPIQPKKKPNGQNQQQQQKKKTNHPNNKNGKKQTPKKGQSGAGRGAKQN